MTVFGIQCGRGAATALS